MERVKAFVAATRDYLREVVGEMQKVVWPTKERTAKLTGVVVGMVTLISLFLFAIDYVLGIGGQKFLGR